MDRDRCTCGKEKEGGACPFCSFLEQPAYWCDSCQQAVVDKRCPLCGLKARKLRADR